MVPSQPLPSAPHLKTLAGRTPILIGLLAAVLFAVTRGYILLALEPKGSDIFIYFDRSAMAVDLHQTPYKGDLFIEYPPLAWWTIYFARTMDSRRIHNVNDAAQVDRAFSAYHRSFRELMFICDLACLALLLLTVRRRAPGWTAWAALTYTVATALLGHLLYDRLDIGLLFWILLWAYCWTRTKQRTQTASFGWTIAGYAALGFGISYKLIPVIGIPYLLLAEWRQPARWKRLALATAALITAVGLPFAIQYAASGPGVFDLFQYHRERGIQLESTYASLMMIGTTVGYAATSTFTHGSYELVGPLAPVMKTTALGAMLLLLGGAALWAFLRGQKFDRAEAYRTFCFVIVAAAVLSPVLSPQYFLWMIPLIVLLAPEVMPAASAQRYVLMLLLFVLAGLTTWIFPYHYFIHDDNPIALVFPPGVEGSVPRALPSIIVGLRNVLCLVIAIWLGLLLVRRQRTSVAVADGARAV